jgi:hypothetical protein
VSGEHNITPEEHSYPPERGEVISENFSSEEKLSPRERLSERFRWLEKLKAGFGASAFVALLVEVFSSSGIARPIVERFWGLAVVVLSLIAFFVAALYADVKDESSEHTLQ